MALRFNLPLVGINSIPVSILAPTSPISQPGDAEWLQGTTECRNAIVSWNNYVLSQDFMNLTNMHSIKASCQSSITPSRQQQTSTKIPMRVCSLILFLINAATNISGLRSCSSFNHPQCHNLVLEPPPTITCATTLNPLRPPRTQPHLERHRSDQCDRRLSPHRASHPSSKRNNHPQIIHLYRRPIRRIRKLPFFLWLRATPRRFGQLHRHQ
jgi:hypothetical protein